MRTATQIKNGLNLDSNIEAAKVVPIENCAMAVLNLAYEGADFDNSEWNSTTFTTKQTLLCTACKNGYKATLMDPTRPFVTECVEIDNCDVTTSTV